MSDSLCSAPYQDLGGDYAEMWSEKMVTARKERHCTARCGGRIHPGEQHGRASYLYGGQWDSIARCQSCVILAEMVGTSHGECAQWGNLADYIEVLNDDLRLAHKRLFPTPAEHREKWEAQDG